MLYAEFNGKERESFKIHINEPEKYFVTNKCVSPEIIQSITLNIFAINLVKWWHQHTKKEKRFQRLNAINCSFMVWVSYNYDNGEPFFVA